MKEKIEDYASTAAGSVILGYFTASGLDQDDINAFLDVFAKADLKEIMIGVVLFFLLYRHKQRGDR